MAVKKYLSLDRLTEYDSLIKAEIAEGDEASIASAKSYANGEITKITNGTTVAAKATQAASADVATKLSAAKTISLTGNASGSVSFDGSKDVSITVTVADDGHNHVISNIDGLQSALDGKAASGHNHNDLYYTEEEIDTKLAGKSDSGHNHDSAYDAKGAAAAALTSAQTYADSAASKVKNDLLNGAGTAYDTLKELGDLIDDNQDAIEALELVASGKADAEHSHAIADVSGLQSALDGKANASHGTHVSYSTTAPVMDGTASAGSADTVARSDHKHPTDTTRAAKTDLDALTLVVNGKAESGHTHDAATTSVAGFMTAAMVAKLNSVAEGANKITVDSVLSETSTNPVQNKVVNTALAGLTDAVSAHTEAIMTMQGIIDNIQEITPAEIQALFA